jgi:ATP-binding cassette subfamily F protein 3
MAGVETPTEGVCELGGKVNVVHFAQYDTATLRSSQSVLKAIEETAPAGEQMRARDVLGAFLFSGDDVDKPLQALSGGERTRFRLAQILFSSANLLLLDEPTNHLDITSRATVERALRAYSGTVVVVSHDRVFMDKVTERIIEIDNGRVTVYPGKYSDYLIHKQMQVDRETPEAEPAATAPPESSPPDSSKEQRRMAWKARKKYARKVRALERQIESIESTIAKSEARLTELETAMADPAVATDYAKLAPVSEEHRELKRQLQETIQHWESVQHELEALRESDGDED